MTTKAEKQLIEFTNLHFKGYAKDYRALARYYGKLLKRGTERLPKSFPMFIRIKSIGGKIGYWDIRELIKEGKLKRFLKKEGYKEIE